MIDECIEWDGALTQKGYGIKNVRVDGAWKIKRVHRLVWEEEYGPISAGMFIRHKCDNPPCILLDHLEIGTAADNSRDMVKRNPQKKTHCLRGHEFAGGNLGTYNGNRYCKKCRSIFNLQYSKRNREKVNALARKGYHSRLARLS